MTSCCRYWDEHQRLRHSCSYETTKGFMQLVRQRQERRTCGPEVDADDCAQVRLCLLCCQAQRAQSQCHRCIGSYKVYEIATLVLLLCYTVFSMLNYAAVLMLPAGERHAAGNQHGTTQVAWG